MEEGSETATVRGEALDDERPPGRRLGRLGPRPKPAQVIAPTLSFDRDEEQRTRVRIRRILNLALAMAPLILLGDWYVCRHLEPSPLGPILALRGGSLAALAVMALLLRLPGKRRLVPWFEALMSPALAVAIGLSSLLAGGIGSVYGLTIIIVLVGRGITRTQPWRDAIPMNAITTLIPPAMAVGAAFVSPRIAAQWRDPAAFGHLATYTLLSAMVAALAVAGGHSAYLLRRALFEARDVGRYRLLRPLGQGGMGEVWAAYYPPLHREVALKILRLRDKDPAQQIARFEREVAATAELTHPNTVRIFDFGVTDDGLWYYAMELLEGDTLRDLVERDGPLEPARAAHLLGAAASAIAEAHGRGIVHRDLKPDNLFVTHPGGERDFIKVLDFGLAKRPDDTEGLTHAGLLGTPAYFAPEVAAGEPADRRADVYALGAILYHALTGRPPFQGEGVTQLLYAITCTTPATLAEARGAAVPPAIEKIVGAAMARDPDARPSAGALAAALGEIRGG